MLQEDFASKLVNPGNDESTLKIFMTFVCIIDYKSIFQLPVGLKDYKLSDDIEH